ncbi:hypothetical protein G7Y89_g13992 [Cudoniella acicularis]|uniref:Uncharacterized protein n=1 Tax=Cudoniella acicularis TaxID=354080 RepID=A0A8H4R6F6_9HELO|nr:hypothetical protein G7Y89_g13992 [Cudoniella acicularis]
MAESESSMTAQQLALVHAAMMEELGIGRKDTLPLEDRGPAIPIQNMKTALRTLANPNNQVTAHWSKAQFDDVDPAQEELDSIADGQLYRLRRGTPNGLQPSRGRGGFSSRGGRGHIPGRGGYNNVNNRGGHSQFQGHSRHSGQTSTPTPVYFDQARRRQDASRSALLEAAINRLRGNQDTPKHNKAKARDGAVNTRPADINTTRPARTNRQPINSTFNLVGSEQFLTHITPVQPTTPKQQQPVPLSSATGGLSDSRWATLIVSAGNSSGPEARHPPVHSISVALQPMKAPEPKSAPHPMGVPQPGKPSGSVSIPQPVSALRSAGASVSTPEFIQSEDAKQASQLPELNTQRMPVRFPMPKEGLSASRWATSSVKSSPSIASITTNKKQHSPASVSSSNGIAPASVASFNDQGIVAVVPSSRAPSVATDNLTFAQRQVTHTFNAKIQENGEAGKMGMVRVLQSDDQSPRVLEIEVEGKRVVNTTVPLNAILTCSSSFVTFSNVSSSTVWTFTCQLPGYALRLCKLITEDPNRPGAAANTASSTASISSTQVVVPANVPLPLGASASGSASASNGTRRVNSISKSTQSHPASINTELISTSTTADLIRDTMTTSSGELYAQRLTVETYTDLHSLEGGETLINLWEDDPNQMIPAAPAPSALLDLAILNDDYIAAGVCDAMDGYYGGSFLDHISTIVGEALDGTAEQVLSNEKFKSVADQLVRDFFRTSEIFARLNDEEEAAYIKDMGVRVFARALFVRDQAENNLTTEDPGVVANDSMNPETTISAEAIDHRFDAFTEGPSPIKRTYSREELLKLRNEAVDFKYELTSKEGEKIPREKISKRTGPEVRIVLGRQNMASRDDTRRRPAPSTPTDWQGFAGLTPKGDNGKVGRMSSTSSAPMPVHSDSFAVANIPQVSAIEQARQETDELKRQAQEMEAAKREQEKKEAELVAKRDAEKATELERERKEAEMAAKLSAEKAGAEKRKLEAEENDHKLKEAERAKNRAEPATNSTTIRKPSDAEGQKRLFSSGLISANLINHTNNSRSSEDKQTQNTSQQKAVSPSLPVLQPVEAKPAQSISQQESVSRILPVIDTPSGLKQAPSTLQQEAVSGSLPVVQLSSGEKQAQATPQEEAVSHKGQVSWPATTITKWNSFVDVQSNTPWKTTHQDRVIAVIREDKPAEATVAEQTIRNEDPKKVTPETSGLEKLNTDDDLALFNTILDSVNKKDIETFPDAAETANAARAQSATRGSKHHATNSDCDRLAKRFEGMNLGDNSAPTNTASTPKTKLSNSAAMNNWDSPFSPAAAEFKPAEDSKPIDLSKNKGLKDSKWASEGFKIDFKARVRPPFPTPRPPRLPQNLANPLAAQHYANASTPVHNSMPFAPTAAVASSTPVFQPLYQPVTPMQTVLIQDVRGNLVEVPGMVKGTPIHHMGMPSSEVNIPGVSFNSFPSLAPSSHPQIFPQRPGMVSRHVSNASSNTDAFFNHAGSVLKSPTANRGRQQDSSSPTPRQALSPVRSNIQATLQKRLDSSIANRSSPGGSRG